MATLFRRNGPIQCFFCQTTNPSPSNSRNFKCPTCGCWNRYDAKGEISSDEPAMHDERLNSKSFAKRGSPSKDRLPNQYGPGPFCHTCQTNQMLLINLLSNYLPELDSSEYDSRLQMLPAYRKSLHTRYPPVCEKCLPLVEDEIQRKDHMARVQALGGWLSKGKNRQRRVSNDVQREKTKYDHTLFWWRVRGCLWALSTVISLVGNACSILGCQPFRSFNFLQPVLPILAVISLLWAAWDPTYSSFLKAQQQNRQVRIEGKYTYNALQMLSWTCRLICSSVLSAFWVRPGHEALQFLESPTFFRAIFLIELISLLCSAVILRIHQPPSIRLVDAHAHNYTKSRSGTPVPPTTTLIPTSTSSTSASKFSAPKFSAVVPENDLLASLSLSSNPVMMNTSANSKHHVFGKPSMGSTPITKEEPAEDEMDWIPTNPLPPTAFGSVRRAATSLINSSETANWIRPQKFFAPEKPTGLEGLFENARIQDEPMMIDTPGSTASNGQTLASHFRRWGILYILVVAVLVVSVCMHAKKIKLSPQVSL